MYFKKKINRHNYMSDPLDNLYSNLTSLISHNHYYYYGNNYDTPVQPSTVQPPIGQPSTVQPPIGQPSTVQPSTVQPPIIDNSNQLDQVLEQSINNIIEDILRVPMLNNRVGVQNITTPVNPIIQPTITSIPAPLNIPRSLQFIYPTPSTTPPPPPPPPVPITPPPITPHPITPQSSGHPSTTHHIILPTTSIVSNISDNQNSNNISLPNLEISGINISRLYPTVPVESIKLSIEELDKNSTLTVFSYDEAYQEDHCSICSDIFIPRDIIRIIKKCNHVFHQSCIDRWFYNENLCAICRQDIRGHHTDDSTLQDDSTLPDELPIHSTLDDNIIPTYNLSLPSDQTIPDYYDGYSDEC